MSSVINERQLNDEGQPILEWGETAWDKLSREELLLEIWRMYSALSSAKTVIEFARIHDLWDILPSGTAQEKIDKTLNEIVERNPRASYWSKVGTGGKAREEVRQAMLTGQSVDSESSYRMFFRYATTLLFDRSVFRLGFGWAICPKCQIMIGEQPDGTSMLGKSCSERNLGDKNCDGVFRAITWNDLRRQSA